LFRYTFPLISHPLFFSFPSHYSHAPSELSHGIHPISPVTSISSPHDSNLSSPPLLLFLLSLPCDLLNSRQRVTVRRRRRRRHSNVTTITTTTRLPFTPHSPYKSSVDSTGSYSSFVSPLSSSPVLPPSSCLLTPTAPLTGTISMLSGRFVFAANAIVALYSLFEMVVSVWEISWGLTIFPEALQVWFDFSHDQVFAYLLMSAQSAGTALARVLKEDQATCNTSSWFCMQADISIALGFAGFLFLGFSSLLSGFRVACLIINGSRFHL
ncbi:hypothetical protein G4B88_019336, partial [Cannabis sativa]